MNILEVNGMSSGTAVRFKAVLAEKKLSPKSNGGNFLNITLSDNAGRISTPIFDNTEMLNSKLEIGKAYQVEGVVNQWNDIAQVKNISFKELKETEYTADDFISSYEIPSDLIEFFKITVDKLCEPYRTITRRAVGMDKSPEMWTAFLSCPSAEKHHGNKIGGLFLHVLGVMTNVVNAYNVYTKINMYGDISQAMNKDRLICKAILHDIMKVREYEYKTVIRRTPGVLGHLIDGPIYLSKINDECGKILDRELLENLQYSMLSHHGTYGPYEPKTVEDIILHMADMIDSRIVGELEKQRVEVINV